MPHTRLVALRAARSLPGRAKSPQLRQTTARVSSEMLSPWMKSTFSGNGMAERARSMPSTRPVVTVFMMSESQRVVPPNLQPISATISGWVS